MLLPDVRQTIVDALRPPSGYALDLAVGTTYSLNLDAALTPATAFAVGTMSTERDEGASLEAIELLDAIRRHSDRITIFFQSGQIPVVAGRQLYTFLEGSLVPVSARLGGVFHPKVWVVRFIAEDGALAYRTLCASRNLTQDRSWDSLLRFDSITDGSTSEVKPDGLSQFIEALPGLAVNPMADERSRPIHELAHELKQVGWSLPKPFTSARFIPMGIGKNPGNLFNQNASRMAVVSPFLSSSFLNELPSAKSRMVIVSSPDHLEQCAETVSAKFGEDVWVLDPDAAPDVEEKIIENAPTDDPGIPFRGLHAKLFVTDNGSASTILTGSANATAAAFNRNVEFMTELTGPSSKVGVRPLFAEPVNKVQTFSSFLMQYSPGEAADESDSDSTDFLDDIRRLVSQIPFECRAVSSDNPDVFRLTFASDQHLLEFPGGAKWTAWPISLPEQASQQVNLSSALRLEFSSSFESITPFLANEIQIGEEKTRFVLCAQLVEAPSNRNARVLRLMLENSERLIRYLLLLLTDERDDIFSQLDLLSAIDEAGGSDWRVGFDSLPLLEVMLRALARDPKRLADVHRLMTDLRELVADDPTFDKHGLLDQFEAVWEPIWSAAIGAKS